MFPFSIVKKISKRLQLTTGLRVIYLWLFKNNIYKIVIKTKILCEII